MSNIDNTNAPRTNPHISHHQPFFYTFIKKDVSTLCDWVSIEWALSTQGIEKPNVNIVVITGQTLHHNNEKYDIQMTIGLGKGNFEVYTSNET